MFIPPIAQSRKPSREPKNKKSILAATFLRLAIVPSCRITDHGAKVQVIRHETSDSCFAWGERELLIAKKLQKYLDFCFDNGRICRSRTNPAKDRLPTAATKSIPRNRGCSYSSVKGDSPFRWAFLAMLTQALPDLRSLPAVRPRTEPCPS